MAVNAKLKLLTLVTLDNENELNNKVVLFKSIAIDNRIRFCHLNSRATTCSLFYSNNSPREAKLAKMSAVSEALFLEASREQQQPTNPDPLLWLDADALITSPRHDFSTAVSCASTDIALSKDIGQYSNKFNSGVMILCPKLRTISLISKVVERMTQFGKKSDQKVLNRVLGSKAVANVTVADLPRIEFNAFPTIAGDEWALLRNPKGDEVPGKTKIVHFAGQFGGADLTTGKADDPGVLLLSSREFLRRHLAFLRLCLADQGDHAAKPIPFALANAPGQASCTAVGTDRAISLLESQSQVLSSCLDRSSQVFDDNARDRIAQACLKGVRDAVAGLWSCA